MAAGLNSVEGVSTLVKETVSRFGRVDILVNNAGAIVPVDGGATLRI